MEYLKGFYSKVIYFDRLERKKTFKDKIINKIDVSNNLKHQYYRVNQYHG